MLRQLGAYLEWLLIKLGLASLSWWSKLVLVFTWHHHVLVLKCWNFRLVWLLVNLAFLLVFVQGKQEHVRRLNPLKLVLDVSIFIYMLVDNQILYLTVVTDFVNSDFIWEAEVPNNPPSWARFKLLLRMSVAKNGHWFYLLKGLHLL